MNEQNWKVYWSNGPTDNPDDGVVEVLAECARDAEMKVVNDLGDAHMIDAIIRADLDEDIHPRRDYTAPPRAERSRLEIIRDELREIAERAITVNHAAFDGSVLTELDALSAMELAQILLDGTRALHNTRVACRSISVAAKDSEARKGARAL